MLFVGAGRPFHVCIREPLRVPLNHGGAAIARLMAEMCTLSTCASANLPEALPIFRYLPTIITGLRLLLSCLMLWMK
jgi:hypothetical protein